MHQTKKGQQWFFGMKAPIGVDADSGLVHTASATAANESDGDEVALLLHGKEEVVHGDAGYAGAHEQVSHKNLRWEMAAKRGRIKAIPEGAAKWAIQARPAYVRPWGIRSASSSASSCS